MKSLSGNYSYRRNGELQDIQEPWGWQFDGDTSVLSGQRIVAGVPVLEIRAAYQGSRCITQQLRWQALDAGPDQPSRDLNYRIEGAQLRWSEAGHAAEHSLPLPPGALQFPLLRAASGRLLLNLQRGAGPVVLPNLRVAPTATDFLHPILSERWVEAGSTAGHYRYLGGEYGDAGADYWLNADSILERYRWAAPDGVWEIQAQSG